MITNLHSDTYADFYEAPLQGPFNVDWVGGREYRHTLLNSVDTRAGGKKANNANNLDAPSNRGEGFKILLGLDHHRDSPRLRTTATGALGIVDPRYPEADDGDTTDRRGDVQPNKPPYRYDRPKGNRFRAVTAKRPVNIANVAFITGAKFDGDEGFLQRGGNFQKNYEVINTCGRTYNDPFFNDESFSFASDPETTALRGRSPLTSSISPGAVPAVRADVITGTLDYALPARTGSTSNKTVIVNRFSAPGGYEVQSRGHLDPQHEEFSVNNNLNFRNLTVRGLIGFSMVSGSEESLNPDLVHVHDQAQHYRGLKTLLSLHSTRFGGDPVFTPTPDDLYGRGTSAQPHPDISSNPSYHKVQRNTRLRLEFTGDPLTYYDALANDVVTASVHDNGWITHPIPQSDRQYLWVTSSLTGTDGGNRAAKTSARLFGYIEPSAGVASSVPTLSASAADLVTLAGAAAGQLLDWTRNFVGLNWLMQEPVSCSTQTLGHTNDVMMGAGGTYMIRLSPTTTAGGTGPGFARFGGGNGPNTAYFNVMMLHRNGPYQYPTWKQVRTAQHPVAKHLRKNNIISVRSVPEVFNVSKGSASVQVRSLKGNSFNQYKEQPISSRHHPMLFLYNGAAAKVSWANNLDYFSNESLNNSLEAHKNVVMGQAYQTLIGQTLIASNAALEYKERIYPREALVYQKATRARTTYLIDNIFASTRDRRAVGGFPQLVVPTSSFGFPFAVAGRTTNSASIWPLDAHGNGTIAGSHGPEFGGANGYSTAPPGSNQLDGAGELQILNAWHAPGSGTLDITSSAIYAMRVPIGHGAGGPAIATHFGGDTHWNVTSSNKVPYRDYDEYCQYLRLIGKDHTIVPEFRISEHIEDYVADQGDWYGDIDDSSPGVFDLTGSKITDSSQDNFYKVYATSDFLKYFKVVDDDILERNPSAGTAIKRNKLILEASALLQFLPYKGFYPAERTLELAKLFSSSYAESVSSSHGAHPTFDSARLRPFISPLFSPGILYNTVKSGIAVGSFVINNSTSAPEKDISRSGMARDGVVGQRGTEGRYRLGNRSVLSGNIKANSLNDQDGYALQRIPFEALYNPRNYLAYTHISGGKSGKIYDYGLMSASLSHSSVNVRGAAGAYDKCAVAWNGKGGNLYELAIDNFLCETVNFFLHDNTLTTFQSLGEEDFDPDGLGVVEGEKYAMTLNLYRTLQKGVSGIFQEGATGVDIADHTRFEMYDRASAFGPPFALGQIGMTSEDGDEDAFSASYAPVTPGYFYGSCSVDIIYTPTYTGTPTLDEIFNNMQVAYSRSMEQGYTHDSLGYFFGMQISASFNIKDTAVLTDTRTGESKRTWLMQSKFETPVLNFADATPTTPGDPNTLTGDNVVSKGMWHQYGSLIEETDVGIFAEINTPILIDDSAIHPTMIRRPKSLAKLVGFEEGVPKRIGRIKDRMLLREAIVAVPYTVVNKRRKFYKAPERSGQRRQMTNLLQTYIFPPKFDYVLNNVTPILFYGFEFTKELTKQNLADLWQNIMFEATNNHELGCESSNTVISDETTVTRQEASCTVEDEELIRDIFNCSDNLKWLVFKVKKRAAKDYTRFIKKGLAADDTSIPSNNESKYSYNWPYDYFSLVELVKIDATAQYKNEDIAGKDQVEAPIAGAATVLPASTPAIQGIAAAPAPMALTPTPELQTPQIGDTGVMTAARAPIPQADQVVDPDRVLQQTTTTTTPITRNTRTQAQTTVTRETRQQERSVQRSSRRSSYNKKR